MLCCHPFRMEMIVGIEVRWCRFAQPPATGFDPFGMDRGEVGGKFERFGEKGGAMAKVIAGVTVGSRC